MKTNNDLFAFFNQYQIGVLSYLNEQKSPSAAIVGFGQTPELKIIFATSNTSRKYSNLHNNDHVSFTVGGNTPETIQLEGVVRELDSNELTLVEEHLWQKNPFAKKVFEKDPSLRHFIITPQWIRYTDIRVHPWDITELHL